VVIVKDGKIDDVITQSSLTSSIEVKDLGDNILTPALIDVQIYGAYGKLLSVYPGTDALHKLNEYCIAGGAAFCMPTVATNSYTVFRQCIDAIKEYWNSGGRGILGLHLEGPWINAVKRGAHIESFIHQPDLAEVKEILDYGKGVIKIITLAPEICGREIVEYILSEGIVVSAGHSNATYEQAQLGFDWGITTATHLYNAMSPLQHRAPGLVGAVMTSEKIMSSIIPDGHHVDYAAIRIAKEVMKERLFAITDAVTETTEGPYPHYFVGDKYESKGILSGSALTMNKAIKNLVDYAGIKPDEAIRMCSLYPAKAIGMEKDLGRIRKGHRSALSLFDEDLKVITVLYD
jgi:N-acetylglucosamine-6-phosphate deacetylase